MTATEEGKRAPAENDKVELASEEQLVGWVERFSDYRHRPSKKALLAWLERFLPEHVIIGHKLLDAVQVVSEMEIHQGYKDALADLGGWSKSAKERAGRWYFVGVGSAGESGPAMLRMFREANGLTSDSWQSFFITAKDLPRLALSAFDHVVFVDDFAGTGNQMVDYWPIMEELVASEAKCYLLLTAVTTDAAKAIKDKTELELRASITLEKCKNVFSEECKIFTDDEKAALEKYGKIAWKDHPRGFGGCGLTLVLSHKTPNNTLPVLHANHDRWEGPFPRNLIKAA
ncbi:hypothetical protein [Mesorhizobium sp. ES1-1]|uniref:phosphoribosyltransferase-like protein n=1 Tax=Mesorhizobium sp. ES1-1 TaxID=2876629 RepID=UPI001CD0131E|nr:hypothetical protein [Mesorhizobium sp. ES1-1]MBZ9676100.1 hypothetical protein [Mesorhizobium sp. ES1-1]